jgi:hypothetical protein
VPSARWAHDFSAHERASAARWRQRGRTETYFRARHLERSPLNWAAFAVSLLAETVVATLYSLRYRGWHVAGYLEGVLEMLRDRDYRYPRPENEPAAARAGERASARSIGDRAGTPTRPAGTWIRL